MTATLRRPLHRAGPAARFLCLATLLAACAPDSAARRERRADGEVDTPAPTSRAISSSSSATAPEPVADSAGVSENGLESTTVGTGDTTRTLRTDSARFAEKWAAVKHPRLLPGAILPNRRIVAYYGNVNSKKMGILGELPAEQMMARLDAQAKEWERADPSKPVLRVLEHIAVVAQGDAGKDGLYRRREAPHLIERVYGWAHQRGWHSMLDIQLGHSNYRDEVQFLLPWLQRPDVHLALDPEFDMSNGVVPGRKIGTTDAGQVNEVIGILADLVTKYKLPPKVLVVHRFTRNMLTNYDKIRLDPRVQVVIDMDGWGAPFLKRATYRQYVAPYPVQFTGFKLFYHNDTKKGHALMKPADVLKLYPKPLFIMYQ
jgi:hypothetical protein